MVDLDDLGYAHGDRNNQSVFIGINIHHHTPIISHCHYGMDDHGTYGVVWKCCTPNSMVYHFFLYSKSPGGIPPILGPACQSLQRRTRSNHWLEPIHKVIFGSLLQGFSTDNLWIIVAVPFQRYHSFLAVSCAGPIFPRTKYDRHHSLVDIHQSCSNLLETIGFSGYIPHFW